MKRYLALLIVPVFMIACASGGKIRHSRYNCSGKVKTAIEKYNQRHYNVVETIIEDVKYQCSGSPVMDTALYYLSMSYLKEKKYTEARSEFERLSRDYAGGAFALEAQFRMAQIGFLQSNPADRDQTETKDAVRLLRDFVESHTDSPWADSAETCWKKGMDKLAEKEFKNARFYEKLNEYDAAIVYYRALLQEYPVTRFTDQARLNIAADQVTLKRYQEAKDLIDNILATSKNDDIVQKARDLRSRLQ